MKMIWLATAILIGSAAFAQTTPIRVKVGAGSDDPSSQGVIEKLSARIGSTTRYALVTKSFAELLVSVDCLPNVVSNRKIGITCHLDLLYWPVLGVPLAWNLTGAMSAAGSDSDVADDLFNDFVQSTSDEQLREAHDNFKKFLNETIAENPQGVQ